MANELLSILLKHHLSSFLHQDTFNLLTAGLSLQTYLVSDLLIPSDFDQLLTVPQKPPTKPPSYIDTLMLTSSILAMISLLSLHIDVSRLRYEASRHKQQRKKFTEEMMSLVGRCRVFAESVLWLGIEAVGHGGSDGENVEEDNDNDNDGEGELDGKVGVGDDGEDVVWVETEGEESPSESGTRSNDMVNGNRTEVDESNGGDSRSNNEAARNDADRLSSEGAFRRLINRVDSQWKGLRELLEMEPSPRVHEQINTGVKKLKEAAKAGGSEITVTQPPILTHSWGFAWITTTLSLLCLLGQVGVIGQVLRWMHDTQSHTRDVKLGMGGATLIWIMIQIVINVGFYMRNLGTLVFEWIKERRTGRPSRMAILEGGVIRENRTIVYSIMSLILLYGITTVSITEIEKWPYRWSEQWFISVITGIGFTVHNVQTTRGKVIFV
ncbi:hypothetical protein HDU76_011287, partial [Blyttiomyces sp. JEL0837]